MSQQIQKGRAQSTVSVGGGAGWGDTYERCSPTAGELACTCVGRRVDTRDAVPPQEVDWGFGRPTPRSRWLEGPSRKGELALHDFFMDIRCK